MADFALKYFAEMTSKHERVVWRAEISERGYSGAPEEMRFAGSRPLSISWERRGDEFYVPIKASEATIKVMCFDNFHFIGLFTSDPRKYRMTIFRNGGVCWRGFVVADLYSEGFDKPPYEVSIKAVDGFSLLSNIELINLDGSLVSGRKSLWEMLSMCVNLLELELPICDWMDLYADGMDQSQSPLAQAYVDMEHFYAAYDKPKYRDVLELCLCPFGGQIFQSGGTIYIRRLVSLYDSYRPRSFFDALPTFSLATADRRELIASNGRFLMGRYLRRRVDGMWGGNIFVQTSSTLDVVPAVRSIVVSAKRVFLSDITSRCDFYTLAQWVDPMGIISAVDTILLGVRAFDMKGDAATFGAIATKPICPVNACENEVTLSFKALYDRGYGSAPANADMNFCLMVTSSSSTWWWNNVEKKWTTQETYIVSALNLDIEGHDLEFKLTGFPADGIFQLRMKQTLRKYGANPQRFNLSKFKLEIDTKDYKEPQYTYMVNASNSSDIQISLPIADLDNSPNVALLCSLYLMDNAGEPTSLWRIRGRNNFDTLVNLMAVAAMSLRERHTRRIQATIHSGEYIDLNTVVEDDKYLATAFAANSIEIDCLEDDYTVELVELPGFSSPGEQPPEGDDCVEKVIVSGVVEAVVGCSNKIILLVRSESIPISRAIYAFDPANNRLSSLVESIEEEVSLYPSDQGFVYYIESKGGVVMNPSGIVIRRQFGLAPMTYVDNTSYTTYTTAAAGVYNFEKQPASNEEEAENFMNHLMFFFGRYPSPSHPIDITNPTDLILSQKAIAINCDEGAYLHDRRIYGYWCGFSMFRTLPFKQMLSFSDYRLCGNSSGAFLIYRRSSLSSETLIKTIWGAAECAAHTLAEVAYSQSNNVKVWNYAADTIIAVKNIAGGTRSVKGLFYINGDLYIVRETGIFKYIEK